MSDFMRDDKMDGRTLDMDGSRDMDRDVDMRADTDLNPAEHEERIEELKEACHSCSNAEHQELDTSQGDFTTIAAGILLALAAYGIIPAVMGFRLGDLPTVVVYGGFLLLTVIFWFLAEKVKEKTKK